ncbi:MAG: hypothetical protein AB7F89_05965, partial [Pirellulaceae bacterium]
IEYSRMSADEQVVADVLDDFFSRSRQRGTEILLAHEWRKVAASWRKEAWLTIRSAIQESPPTSHLTKHDLEVSVLWKVNSPTDTVLVRNTSSRVLQDVTLVLEHSTDGHSRIAGYHVAAWEAGRAYSLKISDETLNMAPQRTREAVPFHLVVADAVGPAINASLSQRPASRFSPDFPGFQEIILEDAAPVFEPPALLRRVQSLVGEHNSVMAGIRKAIKAEQSIIRRAKRRLDKDQLTLFEADVAKVSRNELPATFHLEQSQRARSSREDLVSRLASLKSVAKSSGLESLADYVDDVLRSVSSQKPLAAIAIAGDSSVDSTIRPPPLIARSNLETFIQLAESRLHNIEGKIGSNIERQSQGEQRERLEEIRRLRQAGQLPDWCREGESAYFRDLDAKFRNSLQRLPERGGPGESHVTRASILAEYEARYAKLLSNSVAQ